MGIFPKDTYNVKNIAEIPLVQKLFNHYNAKPTYLVNWPVATNDKAVRTLKTILDENNFTIGTHCHSWILLSFNPLLINKRIHCHL